MTTANSDLTINDEHVWLVKKLEAVLGGNVVIKSRTDDVYCKRAAIIRFLRNVANLKLKHIGKLMGESNQTAYTKTNFGIQNHATIINALKPNKAQHKEDKIQQYYNQLVLSDHGITFNLLERRHAINTLKNLLNLLENG